MSVFPLSDKMQFVISLNFLKAGRRMIGLNTKMYIYLKRKRKDIRKGQKRNRKEGQRILWTMKWPWLLSLVLKSLKWNTAQKHTREKGNRAFYISGKIRKMCKDQELFTVRINLWGKLISKTWVQWWLSTVVFSGFNTVQEYNRNGNTSKVQLFQALQDLWYPCTAHIVLLSLAHLECGKGH